MCEVLYVLYVDGDVGIVCVVDGACHIDEVDGKNV